MPSLFGTGFAHAGESYYLRGPAAAWWPAMRPVPLLVYLHGATGTGAGNAADLNEAHLIRLLARRFLVLASDWGGPLTFANDTAIARVHGGIAAARTALNVDARPVVVVGMSMGAGLGLAYALEHPDQVAAVAGMIPMLDVADIRDNNRGGLGAAVDAAYGGTYSDSTHGPVHSPVRFAEQLPEDLPVAVWTSSNDTSAVPATAAAFLAARPQTTAFSLGAAGHSTASIAGTQAAIAAWCTWHTL